MKYLNRASCLLVLISLFSRSFAFSDVNTFESIEIMQTNGDDVRETAVRVKFGPQSMQIVSRSGGTVLKEWDYASIKSAEYSYSKNPRWKAGLGLGAAGLVFPPLLLIAIPIGFTKHRRHWVTIRADGDYAVLKVSKRIRKVFMPAFETYTSVRIHALGDDK
jgi:hypothetical protein